MRGFLKKLRDIALLCAAALLFALIIAAVSLTGESDDRRMAREAAERIGYIHDGRANQCFAVYRPKSDNEKEIRLVSVPCTPEVLKIAERR